MGKKLFSLAASVMLVSSTLLIGISIRFPNASAASVNHTNGNVRIEILSDWGRILGPIKWGSTDQTGCDFTSLGFIGLVVDQDNYDHTPGSENIADSFSTYMYVSNDDFATVEPIDWLIDNPTTKKSFASFKNTGAGTLDPDDILIEQTAWTITGKDWAIIQWTLVNIKSPSADLTNVSLGLELPLSQTASFYSGGVGGDSGDDARGNR